MARIGWIDLLAYYRTLADNGEPPMRGRFDPVVGVPRAVALLTLYGVESAGFRIRIVGSEVGRWTEGPRVGRMLPGHLLDEVALDLPIRDAIRDALRRTASGRSPVLTHYLAQYDEPVRWTSLYLPLADGLGCVSAVVVGTFHEIGEPVGILRSFRADTDADALAADRIKAPH